MAEPGSGGSEGATPPPSPYGSPPGQQPRTVSPYLAEPPSTGPYDPSSYPTGYGEYSARPAGGYPPVDGYPPAGSYPPSTPAPPFTPASPFGPASPLTPAPPFTPASPFGPASPLTPASPVTPDPLPITPVPPVASGGRALPEPGVPVPGWHPRDRHEPDPLPPPAAASHEEPELHGVRRILHLVGLPILSTLLLAWALTTLIGDVRWGPFSVVPPLLACLSPLLVVLSLPVVAAALRRRNWTALVPALVALGLPWVFVMGYIVPAGQPSGTLLPLRALLVTAREGNADAADIAAAARTQRADLVVVTELSPALAHDLTQTGLPRSLSPRYVSIPEQGQAAEAGLAIYSRFPVDQVQPLRGTYWPAVRARVMVGQRPVTLVTGHAVPPSTDHLDRWRRDLRTFGSAASLPGPVLVLANLNATPWLPQFRALVSGRLHDAADVLGQGLRPTWPSFSPIPLLPTDHALVAGAGVSSISTVTIDGTDHRALSVELTVPAS